MYSNPAAAFSLSATPVCPSGIGFHVTPSRRVTPHCTETINRTFRCIYLFFFFAVNTPAPVDLTCAPPFRCKRTKTPSKR